MTQNNTAETFGSVAGAVSAASYFAITQREISAVFGIQHKSLKSRGLSPVDGKYNLVEVYDKCKDLLFERQMRAIEESSDLDLGELKTQKTAEEVRKLKIDNDIKEGVLVYADDVAQTYDRGLRAMCDVLDAMPSRIKMQNPSIPQSLLDQINQELIKSRNKAVDSLAALDDEGG